MSHKSRLAAFVIDNNVDDIEQANQFWSNALGLPCRRSDQAWADKYSKLATPDGEPDLLIQRVDHESRIHLDIETNDIEAEVERLNTLGATVVKKMERWVVMQAPTGHRFCVVNPQRADFETSPNVNEWS